MHLKGEGRFYKTGSKRSPRYIVAGLVQSTWHWPQEVQRFLQNHPNTIFIVSTQESFFSLRLINLTIVNVYNQNIFTALKPQ